MRDLKHHADEMNTAEAQQEQFNALTEAIIASKYLYYMEVDSRSEYTAFELTIDTQVTLYSTDYIKRQKSETYQEREHVVIPLILAALTREINEDKDYWIYIARNRYGKNFISKLTFAGETITRVEDHPDLTSATLAAFNAYLEHREANSKPKADYPRVSLATPAGECGKRT